MERNPGWTWHDWTSFAMELGLVRQEELAEAPTDSITAAEQLVEAYCQRFRDYHELSTANLVPTSLEVRGQKMGSGECLELFAKVRHGQLVGLSGSGKSLHAEHMALKSLEAGRVPIVARAIDYAGKLTTLLDRSIAHFCPRTATVFIEAVRRLGRPVTLIVDGFNECPMRLRDRLIQDMQAAFLRWKFRSSSRRRKNCHFRQIFAATFSVSVNSTTMNGVRSSPITLLTSSQLTSKTSVNRFAPHLS